MQQALCPAEQAGRLADSADGPQPADLTVEGARALGWALKDLCYSSWSSEPQRALRAAQALRRLHETARPALQAAALFEVEALAAWTDGIARIIQGDMAAAVDRLDAAAAAFIDLGLPRHAAQTQVPKIMALAMLGRHDDAAECARAAQRELLAHGDLVAARKVALNLGNLHLRSERFAAAADHFREAAALFTRAGDPEHAVMAELGLGDALTAFGAFDDAARTFAQARASAVGHGFEVLEALAVESMALLELVRGHYREALSGLEGARQRYARLKMPQQLAIAEKQLADAYLELRLLPEALSGYEAALGRFTALGMQMDRAWTGVQHGRALALAGQSAAAQAALATSLQGFSALDNGVGMAAVALAQAELALAGGDGVQALGLARDAAARFHDAGLVDRRWQAEAVAAQALLRLGDVAQARRLFDTALEAARVHQLLPVQLRCLTGRALAALAAGEPGAAREDFEAAVDHFEDQRRTLPGDELRSAFQVDHLLPFQELLRLELHAHEAGEADAADVLAQLDRFRARTLADRLGAADGESATATEGREVQAQTPCPNEGEGEGGGEGEPHEPQAQGTRERLAWLYRRLLRLDGDAADSAVLRAELQATERQLLEQARRIRLSAAPVSPMHEHAELDMRRLQAALGARDALVEYGVQDDELFACVATAAGVHVQRRLAPWSQVQDTLRALRFQIETLRHGSAPVQRHLPTLTLRAQVHLQRLHALVWQPLLGLLGGFERVLIVPHAQLGSLPFAALHDGRQCLAEQLQIAFAPSGRIALGALSRRPRPAHRVLALGESTRLPHAAREAQAVASMLPHGRALVGTEATLAQLRAHSAGADVLHLACHAQFRTDNPIFSALYLADGVLTADSIPSLRLPGAIVTLSGCETALHEGGGSDEMFGLTRAFLVAGAARVVAALWPVDDAITAEWMLDFYAGLQRGQSPAAALQQAQLASRRRHAHPFYWASFSVMGGW